MNRRNFIRLSTGVLAAPYLDPFYHRPVKERLKNWSGNLTFSTDNVFYPKTVGQVQDQVKRLTKLRGLGTRHCFNDIGDSKFNLVSSKELNKVISIDAKAHTVTVEGGIKYGELAPYLDRKGYALHNLASLPHISVAGSCSTATHGSGVANGNLTTAVRGLEVVTADGSIVYFDSEKDKDKLHAVAVGLGAIGIITKVTLQIQPTYMMRQHVFTGLPLTQLYENFERIMSAGYSVSLFTDWQGNTVNEVWIKSRVDKKSSATAATPATNGGHGGPGEKEFYGAKAATKNLHPIIAIDPIHCTDQMGVPGPWFERLPHFKMGFTPSSGKELQSEYFIPFRHGVEAIRAVSRLSKSIGPHLLITEIRTIAADNLWMSPCHNQKSVTIHFTWKPEWPAVQNLLPKIERELAPFNPRPHWGKLFTMPAQLLESKYEKLAEFKELVKTYDPRGKFTNEFLNDHVYASAKKMRLVVQG